MAPLFYDQQNGSTLYFTQCRSIGLGSMETADLAVSTDNRALGGFLHLFSPLTNCYSIKIKESYIS
jgi:hypothetical protein